ncbi:MAG: hypothetical protein U0401_26285 [Anaerolineae bacterium]
MEALVKAPQTITELTQPNLSSNVASSHSTKTNPSGYFAIDHHVAMSMFGPAITDIEVSGVAGYFLEADDASKYDGINSKSKLPAHELKTNKPSYFTYDDSDVTHEALALLGLAVADEETASYMAHFLA